MADGADTTRVVLRVTDEYDAIRPFANDAIHFELTGPASLIGDNPFSLVGGTGAIWIRASEQPGIVYFTAHHPYLGAQSVKFQVTAAPREMA
jgi:beta-galactosidase